jgi:F0F1-type ATP synthase delta subunit
MDTKSLSINDVNNFDAKSNSLEPLENNLQDQQSFEELLSKDTLDNGSLGSNIMQTFMNATNNVQYYKNSANTAIKKASLNPKMDNILNMMHKMHDYTKETTITARVVSKVTQSVDQLTKLQ